MNVAVNLGGVAVGLAILWLNVRKWWKGNRDPKELIPYGAGSALGSLSTICVGGALGWGASGIAGLFSSVGSKGVETTTGTSGAAAVPTGRMGVLTPEGGVITCLILLSVVVLYKSSGKLDKRRDLRDPRIPARRRGNARLVARLGQLGRREGARGAQSRG
jgi:hypothetical protein